MVEAKMEIKRGSVFYVSDPNSSLNRTRVSVVKAPMAKDGGRVEIRLLQDVWNDTGTIVYKKGEKRHVDVSTLSTFCR